MAPGVSSNIPRLSRVADRGDSLLHCIPKSLLLKFMPQGKVFDDFDEVSTP
jgi:hypothetical protein